MNFSINNLSKNSHNINTNPKHHPDLAIIFCTKNSAYTIENAIKKVKQSRYGSDIVVVDGFSTDDTVKVAKEIEETMVIEQPKRNAQNNKKSIWQGSVHRIRGGY